MYKQFTPDLKTPDKNTRKCVECNIMGDEKHFIYDCTEINRSNLQDIPQLHELEEYTKLELLIEKLGPYL